jgi:NADPH:quinone reductase-like Zn-dependent oxidoreductase
LSNADYPRKLEEKEEKRMKRFAITGYGPANEVFQEITVPSREVTSKHLRVKLKAFSINPYDVALRLGKMQEVRQLKFPYVLGNDGAGVVTEVASDVTHFHVGDQVVVHPISGAYGEEIVLSVSKVAKIPDGMSWAEAASMVTTGITAYNVIHHLLTIQPTDTVMVEGASGGVGTSLIQLLHQKGIRILASASKKNEEMVRKLGVTNFSAYDQEDPGEKFKNLADIVIDATKGSIKGETGIQIMKEEGHYVALNELPSFELRQKKIGFYENFVPRKEYSDQEALTYLLDAYQKGHYQIFVAQELPATLENLIWAHQQIEGHPSAGKIVLTYG